MDDNNNVAAELPSRFGSGKSPWESQRLRCRCCVKGNRVLSTNNDVGIEEERVDTFHVVAVIWIASSANHIIGLMMILRRSDRRMVWLLEVSAAAILIMMMNDWGVVHVFMWNKELPVISGLLWTSQQKTHYSYLMSSVNRFFSKRHPASNTE